MSGARSPSQRGQAQTEFTIILVAVAVISIVIIVNFGGKIATLFGFAHDEIDTMGESDLDFGGGPSGGQPAAPGSQPTAASGGGGDFGSGPTTRGAGRRSSGRGSGRAGRGPAGAAGGDGIGRPSEVRKSGTYVLGGEGDPTTVHAGRVPGTEDQGARGTAEASRQEEQRRVTARRQQDEARWRKRSAEAMEPPVGDAPTGGGPVLGFLRLALLAVLLIGVLFLGRSLVGGGRRGDGDG